MSSGMNEIRDFWNGIASDWEIQVGDDGDSNRRLNSDPILWQFAGNVQGLSVLDAGCGTGYLSAKLQQKAAQVIGVDLSENMIRIAKERHPNIEFYVDSCARLKTIRDDHFDLIVANYVLMDTPDPEETLAAFYRVLKAGGIAVTIFSHPCFPQGRASISEDFDEISYLWDFSYFEERRCTDPPWGHFTSEFTWFHRPLSTYWKTFKRTGFHVTDFEEPRVTRDRYHLAVNELELKKNKMRPYSVAFRLEKKNNHRSEN